MRLPDARLARIRQCILVLLAGPDGTVASCNTLDDADWMALGRLVEAHRLAPRLHGLASLGALPADIRRGLRVAWKESYRRQAMVALAQDGALAQIGALFAGAGIRAVALKGTWLARHAYPAPAERPLRDLDILVPARQLNRAYALLLEGGWRGPALSARAMNGMLSGAVHAPPLVSPNGIACELHTRSWLADRQSGLGPSERHDAALLEHASGTAALACPPPELLLAHLCVHAAYSHRLDVGPLVLTDLILLCHAAPIDWDRFWKGAVASGYARGAALLVYAVDRWLRPGFAQTSRCPLPVPHELLARLPALLLPEPDTRAEAMLWGRLLASARQGGWSGLAGAVRRNAARDGRDRALRPLPPLPALAERVRRIGQVAYALAQRGVRSAGDDHAALADYLHSSGPGDGRG